MEGGRKKGDRWQLNEREGGKERGERGGWEEENERKQEIIDGKMEGRMFRVEVTDKLPPKGFI